MRSTLPRMPFPGLLRDGPPRARLRSATAACICPRQRRPSRPPSSFRLAEKKMVRARARRKGRQRDGPVEQDRAGHRDRRTLYVSGRNRGIAGRRCRGQIQAARNLRSRAFCGPSYRRHGISAAALFAGRREAGQQKANAARRYRWSPRVPRGAASLGAALGAKRTRFFLCRRGDSRIARSPGRRGRRPLQGKRIATPVTSVT